jgi:PhzF family phenazine biosynthesis protein
MDLRVYQVDSFATEVLRGNPAGVVMDAGGLSDDLMQRIAREMNKSETAFIIEGQGEGYDVELRFFTPTREVPICGHATVGAHYVRAKERGMTRGLVRQKTKAGILPVEIEPEEGDLRITMTQAAVELGLRLEGDARSELLAGLGIGEADLAPGLPIQVVSTGHSKVMVPLREKARLDSLSIDQPRLAALSARIACNGYYAFTLDSDEPGILACGRMFAPAIGIPEDPVTGNANGPLGAYLARYGAIEAAEEGRSFEIKQGEAIGRTGYMRVTVFGAGADPRLVKVSGRAVVAFEAAMSL